MIVISQATQSDIVDIDKLGTESYPSNYYEGTESFASKIYQNFSTCLTAKDNDVLVGYIIGFPYIFGKPYPINKIYKPVKHSNCYYIHDLCVDKNYRKLGIGKKLVIQTILNISDNICLVAVLDSSLFWKKFGFVSVGNFDYYGLQAAYMVRLK